MQTMRREWIDEGKPKDRFADDPAASGQVPKQQQPELQRRSSKSNGDSSERPNIDGALQPSFISTAGPKELDSLNSQSIQGHRKRAQHHAQGDESLFISDDEGEDEPPEDDLDALLAEDAQKDFTRNTDGDATATVEQAAVIDDFDDEMEAMAGIEDLW